MIAVNSSDSEVIYSVEDTSKAITYARDIVSDKLLGFSGSSFTDTLQALGVSIYKLHYDIYSEIDKSKKQAEGLSIKPNPFTKSTTIELPSEPHTLTIYDIVGNKVREEMLSGTTTIERADLTKGVYVLEVRSVSQTYSGKLVVE